jgi:hypothetical protein
MSFLFGLFVVFAILALFSGIQLITQIVGYVVSTVWSWLVGAAILLILYGYLVS